MTADYQGYQEPQVFLDNQGDQDLWAKKETMVYPEDLVRLDQKVQKATQGIQGHLELTDLKENLVFQVSAVLKATKETEAQ